MNVTCKKTTQISDVVYGSTGRSPLSTMNLNIKQNVRREDTLVPAKISDRPIPRLATGTLLAEPERPGVGNALEMAEDGFEEDSVACTSDWDSGNEDAELDARLDKWFSRNEAKWADLMRRIQSSGAELGAVAVSPSTKPTRVGHTEVVENYDEDFDVDCDLPCMKLSPSGGNSGSPTTPELLLPSVAFPVFEEPDEDDIEMWLAESEAGSSAAGSMNLLSKVEE